ncbi:MAG: succinate dehydrogenase assembly factor 2 [Rubrivivax sp.]|jgi:antitoxin CptB|nr:succinate dehydrogenase assembly factor 2 [Betaproteobacteria bacterium]MBP6318232.1 succinate dehydrogenase assembly factor 2 [Rubrivivax sp.]MBK7278574.1 succinate dehydrogenase assembly factor 2 [Betaproteobacteria bacterium]MBK7459979.1 succinate dehydrogenase assembly factor 2 [Betaproteobacteria bacterium]MBK7517522.1 succinate dehydrogenase assembly factor 2 [Betaproteobacteria bacterium]
MSELLGEAGLNRLRWRCRRGLLENDLFIERFFSHHEETITTRQAAGLLTLMDLADNDLLDLLLGRNEPQGEVDTPDVREVLALMRCAPVAPRSQWSPQTT